jgi:molybdopterin-dependent oxidoreductase alpha subunit
VNLSDPRTLNMILLVINTGQTILVLGRQTSSYKDIVKTVWENKDRLPYALRILRNGVCDGCALGTYGMRDWTQSGIHLCWIRLNLLRLNTIPPFDPSILGNVSSLEAKTEKELRKLGRLPHPMVRHRGDSGFTQISWDEAIETIASKMRVTDPHRVGFYVVSRGTANETYYAVQKAARFIGTNHIDNSARICHAASTTGLKQTIGYAATTCSYKEMIGTDLIIFIGSNPANNEPVLMKYIHLAKKKGTKVAVVNPYREPGMETYWVPSNWDSELFGTKVADAFFQIKTAGDIAFLNGVLKHLIANDWIDRDFISKHTSGWQEFVKSLESQSFEELERYSGVSREEMLRFAKMYSEAKSTIIVWSMGITQYSYGTSNVKAIVNLALSRGNIGRPGAALMPIRGHSGVQGGAEVGAVPNNFPGGVAVNEEGARKFARLWQFEVPQWKGFFVSQIVDTAWRREIDVLYAIGSNLLGVLPDPKYCEEALARIPLRVHHDIVLNPQMFVEPADTVILLPATTRYEMVGGNTETSTERRIIFSPEVPGPRVPEARDEWRVLVDIAKRVKPNLADKIDFGTTQEIREEISRVIPSYAGIEKLQKKGDQIQWGGERLCEQGKFNTPDGKAHFTALVPLQREIPNGWFQLLSRRGKQFNSIVFSDRDILSGASRNEVIMSSVDMDHIGVKQGDLVTIRSSTGELFANVRSGPVYQGTVVMQYPEANALIRRSVLDPDCGVPAYRDELVQVLRAEAGQKASLEGEKPSLLTATGR